jgi:hypothetical protein|tara:strand:+ start:189 stop:341 length:153 start_codon:yes stop_codon:yes gene_type:complete
MLESIFASLIANMLWDEMKVNKIEKKLESIQETIIDKNNEIKWIISKENQ